MSKQLLQAVASGDLAKVKALITAGADVNWIGKTGPGRTALAEAAIRGHAAIVAHLLGAGADTETQDRAVGYTALGWACLEGHLEVVELLIAAGAGLDRPSRGVGLTPLMNAAIGGHTGIVERLLGAGADAHVTTADGRNAFTIADQNKSSAVVALLERASVKVPEPVADDSLPWPDVGEDLSRVDATRPESVLRGFILSMHRWEVASSAAASGQPDIDQIRAAERAAFERYCTPKERTFGRCGSFGSPPQYAPDEVLVRLIPVSARRVELMTRQGPGRIVRYECRYVLLNKGQCWLIDSRQQRLIGDEDWSRSIL